MTFMKGTSSERTVVAIGTTSTKHQAIIISLLLAAHVPSGCNTRLTRIVKVEAINQLERVHKLSYRVKLIVTLILVVAETTTYIRRCNEKE